ncbi:Putative UbiA prenyltransferase family [Septoria linicola]|uniref:UbiA prenyltransferase family n=1 Tax=Septoria linicola TaxID=215465 RepID=A0A9Q9AI89_9PEZI|nr:putative UbiA prenyltransferase family [Septoria linicola]USW49732.1 Putative UbiA prenyltransferase family [Septoria linicola]
MKQAESPKSNGLPAETSKPSYTAPSGGIFTILPASIVPYAELMRLDRPSGYYAFYWHYAIGIAFAGSIAPVPPTVSQMASLAVYLALWVVIYRGAVCAWNDNIDQDFDRQVARCRNRPIARGAVSTLQGHVFTAAQTVMCGTILVEYPKEIMVYAGIMTVVLGIYPFGKRITDFPQVILGFAFAIPVFMCAAALGADPLLSPATASMRNGALCLYGANTLWTIIFDTVYAHQDIKDDVKAGVRSLAVRLGDQTKLGLGLLSCIQVALMVACGHYCGLSWAYFVFGCGGAAASLFAMLYLVELSRPSSCAWWFGPGSRLVGASIVLGFLGHYVLRLGMIDISSVSFGGYAVKIL